MIKDFLLYVTNNGKRSRNEKEWDMTFFVIITIALFGGIVWLVHEKESAWIAFLVIEYVWALDNMRHNR